MFTKMRPKTFQFIWQSSRKCSLNESKKIHRETRSGSEHKFAILSDVKRRPGKNIEKFEKINLEHEENLGETLRANCNASTRWNQRIHPSTWLISLFYISYLINKKIVSFRFYRNIPHTSGSSIWFISLS